MDHRNHRDLYSQAIPCVAAATPPSPEFEPAAKESLASCGNRAGACKHGAMRATCDGMGILISRIGMQEGWMDGASHVC